MLPTDLVVLGSPVSTDTLLKVRPSHTLEHLPKGWEDQLDPKTLLFFSSKKPSKHHLKKNLHCRGTLTAKPVLKMSTTSYTSHYFLDPYAFPTIQCFWRQEEDGWPWHTCTAQEQPKPLKFCYFIRIPAKLLISNS